MDVPISFKLLNTDSNVNNSTNVEVQPQKVELKEPKIKRVAAKEPINEVSSVDNEISKFNINDYIKAPITPVYQKPKRMFDFASGTARRDYSKYLWVGAGIIVLSYIL